MLKIMLCAALAITVATAASGAPKDRGGSAGDVYRFVGYATTTPRQGGEGFVAMHTSCQEDFGPLARMCTTEEFWLSPNAGYPDSSAWIHPVGTRSGSFLDFTTGESIMGSCTGWINTMKLGHAIGPTGLWLKLSCSELLSKVGNAGFRRRARFAGRTSFACSPLA